MLAPPSLPPKCICRPAGPADQPDIRQMLVHLEREIQTASPLPQWLLWGLILGIVVLVGIYVVLPGTKAIVQPLISLIVICVLLLLIAAFISIQNEWKHYWVIEREGYLIACAKLQHHSTYSILFDLYVLPDWRKQGIGSYLVSQLGQQVNHPLYLACVPARLPFYTRLGFSPVPPRGLPPLLQYDLGLPGRFGIVPLVLTK